MDKLNISVVDSYENITKMQANQRSIAHVEDEKGEHFEEEFDQSRPMTTRIYDNDDDQQLHIQYK